MTIAEVVADYAVHAAISRVDDPEYPGISIVDLGLLESIEIDETSVRVGLIPTFSGCPALAVIATDVKTAVERVAGVSDCEIVWLDSPTWHTDRISHEARACLSKKYRISVQLGERPTTCSLCGSKTVEQSVNGPSPCRSVHSCTGCGETVGVVRG